MFCRFRDPSNLQSSYFSGCWWSAGHPYRWRTFKSNGWVQERRCGKQFLEEWIDRSINHNALHLSAKVFVISRALLKEWFILRYWFTFFYCANVLDLLFLPLVSRFLTKLIHECVAYCFRRMWSRRIQKTFRNCSPRWSRWKILALTCHSCRI